MATRNIYITDTTDPSEDGSIDHPYDTFSDINWTTGGANSIFDWVAADDDVFINLAKGDSWEVALTVGISGVSGHPITIQAYGTGADPIIKQPNGNDANAWITVDDDYITFKDIEFDGNGANQAAGFGRVIHLSAATNIIFDGCTIKNCRNNADAFGVGSLDSSDITIQNCIFSGNYIRSILGQGDACDTWTIHNNTITGVSEAAGIDFQLGPDTIVITDNTISGGGFGIRVGNNNVGEESIGVTITGNNITDFGNSAAASHGIQVFVDGNSDTYNISNNTVSEPANDYDGYKFAWQGNPTTVTINGNTFTNSSSPTGDSGIVVDMFDTGTATITNNKIYDAPHYGIYILGGNNHTITGNLFKDCGVDDFPAIAVESATWEGENVDASNHTIAYNILDTCERGIGLNVKDGLTINDIKIYNNVIYGTYGTTSVVGAGIYLYETDGTMSGILIKNNIFYDNGANYHLAVCAECQTNFVSDNNDFYGSTNWKWGAEADDTSLADWQTASSGDANSIVADPLFVDAAGGNFKLRWPSPCISAGTDVSLTEDYLGKTIPIGGAFDIGAIETYREIWYKKLFNRLRLFL